MDETPRRLRWLCRRGMKELDLVFLRYLETRYPQADAAERARFETLLDQDDPTLWAWLVGAEPLPEGALGKLVDSLRDYR